MTVIFEQKSIGNVTVSIEKEKYSSLYKVLKTYYGKTECEYYYPTIEKAKRRFRYLIREEMR